MCNTSKLPQQTPMTMIEGYRHTKYSTPTTRTGTTCSNIASLRTRPCIALSCCPHGWDWAAAVCIATSYRYNCIARTHAGRPAANAAHICTFLDGTQKVPAAKQGVGCQTVKATSMPLNSPVASENSCSTAVTRLPGGLARSQSRYALRVAGDSALHGPPGEGTRERPQGRQADGGGGGWGREGWWSLARASCTKLVRQERGLQAACGRFVCVWWCVVGVAGAVPQLCASGPATETAATTHVCRCVSVMRRLRSNTLGVLHSSWSPSRRFYPPASHPPAPVKPVGQPARPPACSGPPREGVAMGGAHSPPPPSRAHTDTHTNSRSRARRAPPL